MSSRLIQRGHDHLPRDELRRGSKRREVLTSPSRGSISSGLSRSLSPVLDESFSRRRFLVAAGAGAASLAFPKVASSARRVHPGCNVVLQGNEPMDIRVPFDPATVHDPNAWQPLRYVDSGGTVVTSGFVGAQWQHVTTFAVSPGSLRSPTGPAKYGSPEYLAQAQALIDLSAALTDEQKMIAEYWSDGPHSELPPGHWNLFAQFVSRRDHHGDHEHGLERDV